MQATEISILFTSSLLGSVTIYTVLFYLGVPAVFGDKLNEATANLLGPRPQKLGEVTSLTSIASSGPWVNVLW